MAKQIMIGGIDTLLLEYEKLTKPVTVSDIDTIVTESLDCLEINYHVERQARVESVVYTVYKNDAFLGKFRISRSDDARRTIKYSSINHSPDPELSREWTSIVFKMLYIEIALRIEAREATPIEPPTIAAQPEPPPMQVQSEAGRAVNERRKKRGMNDDTREKLKSLSSIREQNIKNDKVNIAWTTACQRAGIQSETARKHARRLRAKWNDPNYHAEISEFAE
jgi:hypothetical protein